MIRYRVREFLFGILRACFFWRHNQGVYILMYHSIGESGPLSVSRAEFDWQMGYIKRFYDVIRLTDVPLRMRSNSKKPAACVTFDDGFLDVYENALPILQKYSVPATFFITTGSIGGMHKVFYGTERCMDEGRIKDLHARGYEIGAHTVRHPKLSSVPLAAARIEITESKARLERLLGVTVSSFAYPKGDYTDPVKAEVESAGFKSAVTVREGACRAPEDAFALPRVAVDRLTGRVQFKAKLSPAISFYGYCKEII